MKPGSGFVEIDLSWQIMMNKTQESKANHSNQWRIQVASGIRTGELIKVNLLTMDFILIKRHLNQC